jgi:uncharacterized protein (DUF305 family)
MQTRTGSRWRAALAAALALVLGAGVGACGEDQSSRASDQSQRVFLEAMVPHHQSAVEMARVARRRAEHPEVAELAKAIVSAQMREIGQMRRLHQRLFGEPLLENADAHAQLGLSPEAAGMMHGDDAVARLRRKEPFDRAFIDAMIPHHQGAIRMARTILAQGGDTEIVRLAATVVRAQAQEIREMNQWRADWYGADSPAGGVPEEGPSSGSDAEHEGH